MNAITKLNDSERYARCIEASRRVRWEIEEDVIKGRSFDRNEKFLPDGLSRPEFFTNLNEDERLFLNQIQGRTYANIFGLVERFINAKVLEISQTHWMGDQVALEALVRFSDEEIKHQALFREIERLTAKDMPEGYRFAPNPDDVAGAVLSKGTWAVLALTLHIELFTQLHYRDSIDPDEGLSPLYKDVFLFHWKEESQHATIDEMELRRVHAGIGPDELDQSVNEFIELVQAVDGILQAQAAEDARYFIENTDRSMTEAEGDDIKAGILKAYRWQYILSGASHPRFMGVFSDLVTEPQLERVGGALATLM